MKIKLDENVPSSLSGILNALGHDCDSVIDEGLAGHADVPVWQAAQQAERFFVTQDLDFSDPRQFAPGTHFGVLLIRLHNPTRADLLRGFESFSRWNQLKVGHGVLLSQLTTKSGFDVRRSRRLISDSY